MAHWGLSNQKQRNSSQEPPLSESISHEVNEEFSRFQRKPKGHHNAHTGSNKEFYKLLYHVPLNFANNLPSLSHSCLHLSLHA